MKMTGRPSMPRYIMGPSGLEYEVKTKYIEEWDQTIYGCSYRLPTNELEEVYQTIHFNWGEPIDDLEELKDYLLPKLGEEAC